MPTKQARNCRVGDILLYKNEESRMITHIKYSLFKIKSYLFRTTVERDRKFRVLMMA